MDAYNILPRIKIALAPTEFAPTEFEETDEDSKKTVDTVDTRIDEVMTRLLGEHSEEFSISGRKGL